MNTARREMLWGQGGGLGDQGWEEGRETADLADSGSRTVRVEQFKEE